jgi:soluble lytic murein transglycosylase-like protein
MGHYFLEGTIYAEIGAKTGVRPALLYALTLKESGYTEGNKRGPYPFALRGEKGPIYPKTFDNAARMLRQMSTSELRRTDIGIAQISWRWHGHKVEDPVSLLVPTVNLEIAATYLRDNIESEPDDIVLGIGKYHSKNTDRARAYGSAVVAIFNQVVAAQTGN